VSGLAGFLSSLSAGIIGEGGQRREVELVEAPAECGVESLHRLDDQLCAVRPILEIVLPTPASVGAMTLQPRLSSR
jgi:hypothetical protein